MKKKREGSIIKIDISENRRLFARIFSVDIGIYDCIVSQEEEIPPLDFIIQHNIFLYCSIFEDILRKNIFPVIGFIALNESEIKNIPPKFHQDIQNLEDCTIFWADGNERKVKPEECIGLEPSIVWEAEGLKERLQDYIAGKRNFTEEYHKVILTEQDPRFKAGGAGPHLKWDFKGREFYYVD